MTALKRSGTEYLMEKFPMTPTGAKKLDEELAELKKLRPKISKEIGVAIEHGDLSENAEYHEMIRTTGAATDNDITDDAAGAFRDEAR